MTTEDRIQALLEKAAPLRALGVDDPAQEDLARIIDEINRLRAIQAQEPFAASNATVEGDDVKKGKR